MCQLIDFNYDHESVIQVHSSIAGIGPLRLLKESSFNHFGKFAFRWIYWNMLLKGIPIPFVSPTMSTKGKRPLITSNFKNQIHKINGQSNRMENNHCVTL